MLYSKRSLVTAAAVLWCTGTVESVMQSLALDVTVNRGLTNEVGLHMLASQAFYGPIPAMDSSKNPSLQVVVSPSDNHFLCENVTSSEQSDEYRNSILMIPRGECPFELKSLHAQMLGAKAVIIYGALEGRYSLNKTNATDYEYTEADILYPSIYLDYDCNKGKAMIPANEFSFDPLPYNAEQNNPLLSGDSSSSNLCLQRSEDQLQQCSSKACLLTGKKDDNDGTMEACCAWDLPVWLYYDTAIKSGVVQIPSAYLTMQQANVLLSYLQSGTNDVQIVMSARWRPAYNPSSVFIWALGVTVAALAAYLTAGEYRKLKCKILRAQERRAQNQGSGQQLQQQRAAQQPRSAAPEEVLELTAAHAFGFIVMASTTLLVLFYFKIYGIVKIFYALGCSNAVSQVIFQPAFRQIAKTISLRDRIVWRTGTEDFGDITLCDIMSFATGFSLGAVWLIVSYTVREPDSLPFFWITQDLFGACICIMFMKVIRLNSIHVASILLIVAFFYDIFFVFITPMLFKGKSVMITVATSGGPPKADALWCEKYPDDADCQGGDPLPMLLTIPRFLDYQGGSSLLGLGDIVLPGLLISFAARLDAAKSLLGVMGGGSGSLSTHCPEERYFSSAACRVCSGGYFVPLVIAYAIGLCMANMAVYLMQMGQPALLYLVPCTLGTMSVLGWRRQELTELWNGPRALKTADALLYGEQPSNNGINGAHSPLPLEEGHDALSPPSAAEEQDGDVALLQEHGK